MSDLPVVDVPAIEAVEEPTPSGGGVLGSALAQVSSFSAESGVETDVAFTSWFSGFPYGDSVTFSDTFPASDIVFPVTGLYLLAGYVRWTINSSGEYREMQINYNDTHFVIAASMCPPVNGDYTRLSASMPIVATGGDTAQLVVAQDSGGPLTAQCRLSLTYLGTA